MLKNGQRKERLIVDGLLFFGVLLFPPSIALCLGAIISLRYRNYYEFALMALFVDALYRPFHSGGIGLFAFALIYVILSDYVSERVLPSKHDRLR